MLAVAFTVCPAGARADDDQPVGKVEQPDNVTGVTTNEGASERAGAGFDTPWTPQPYNDGKADNLEPKPFESTPNN
jgi:hypothetical protein